MTKTKRVTYKGIPAKARKNIALYRKLGARLTGKVLSPQQVLIEVRNDAAKKKMEEAKRATERAQERRDKALEDLKLVMERLSCVHDVAGAIEDDRENFLDYRDLAAYARLRLQEVGKTLEQALCDFGLIEPGDGG